MRAVGIVTAAIICTAVAAQGQTKDKAPVCRADRHGEDLVTRIEYPNGYVVEGPWRVTGFVQRGGVGAVLTAVLDRIVEQQAFTTKRESTPLPGPVEMTFRGTTQDDVLTQAAHVWCTTIIQARPPAVDSDAQAVNTARITI